MSFVVLPVFTPAELSACSSVSAFMSAFVPAFVPAFIPAFVSSLYCPDCCMVQQQAMQVYFGPSETEFAASSYVSVPLFHPLLLVIWWVS